MQICSDVNNQFKIMQRLIMKMDHLFIYLKLALLTQLPALNKWKLTRMKQRVAWQDSQDGLGSNMQSLDQLVCIFGRVKITNDVNWWCRSTREASDTICCCTNVAFAVPALMQYVIALNYMGKYEKLARWIMTSPQNEIITWYLPLFRYVHLALSGRLGP